MLVLIFFLFFSNNATPQSISLGNGLGKECSSSEECAATVNATCDSVLSVCVCPPQYPVAGEGGCLTASAVGAQCRESVQCRPEVSNAVCTSLVCACLPRHYRHTYADGLTTCLPSGKLIEEKTNAPIDPVMIAILASLVLIFVIICAVLRLFSKARFRQDRTILNSANARLMNTSLFRGPAVHKPRSGDRRRSRVPSVTSTVQGGAAAPGPPGEALRNYYPGSNKEETENSKNEQKHPDNTTVVEVTNQV